MKQYSEQMILLVWENSCEQDIGNHNLYPTRGALNISKAKDMLDYKPQFTFENGLKLYYESIQNTI